MSNHDRDGPQSPGQDTAPDGSLARAWRQASDEQPPPALDAAIIAAARKAVQDRDAGTTTVPGGHRPRTRWMQWQPLAAAASLAGLAFALVQLLPRDRDVVPPIRMEEPTSGPAFAGEAQTTAAPPPAPTVPQAATEEKRSNADTAPSAPEATAEAAVQATAEAPVEATAEAASRATAKASDTSAAVERTGELHATEADQRGALAPEIMSPTTPAAAAAPARERSSDNAAPPSAADRAANIAALYASGDTTEAAAALRAFRAANPNADKYLPDSLRDWARTVE
jgi:resuscitation-promoting factor RpfA